MVMDNATLLDRLDNAIKAVTDVNELGAAVLQPVKFDRFVRAIRDATTVLPLARFIEMDAHIVDIDRVGFAGRVLKSGVNSGAAGSPRRVLNEAEFSVPEFAREQLLAKEFQAITSLRDAALRRNLERAGFEDTLVDLFGEAAGRDLEEIAMLGDTSIAYATDDVLSQTDGWIKQAGNKLYGVDTAGTPDSADFDPTGTNAYDQVENMFEAMLIALPKRYISNVTEWKIWTTWGIRNAYVNALIERGELRGSELQEGPGLRVAYKGLEIVYSPGIERAAVDLALLGHPDNMTWGVFHEVTIEREREAKARRTDFVLTVEADAGYEDRDAAVAAYPTTAKPA